MVRRNWVRAELIDALLLYCRTPFGKIHSRNPEIVSLAKMIGRTPGAVALKMVNFASLDPTIAQKGMGNVSALDRSVWDEVFNNLDRFFPPDQGIVDPNGFSDKPQKPFEYSERSADDVWRVTKARSNQSFFRKMILASYDGKCAVSGFDCEELLMASHIVPWSKDKSLRLNPRNGILLNALHDRAFDSGMITFSPDLNIQYSSKLNGENLMYLKGVGDGRLRMPRRFAPDPDFLGFHRTVVFQP